MKRPRAHEIETQSRQIFERSIPASLVARPQTPDYGVDYDVEVFKDKATTGVTFKVQLKGSECLVLGRDAHHFSCALATESASYLCEELATPTVLAVVDLATQTAYWMAPQLDGDLRARLKAAIKEGRKSLVAHIPAANALPGTTDALLDAIAKSQLLLATRIVQESAIPAFSATALRHFDPDVLVRELTTKAAVVRVQQIRTLYNADKLDEARAILDQVLTMPEVDLGVKFAALEEVEAQETVRFKFPPDTYDAVAKLKLGITARMREVSVGGAAPFRLYALIAHKAAELEMLIFDDQGLYYNWVAQHAAEAAGGPFWKLGLSLSRQRTRTQLVRKYRQCIRLVNLALRSGYHGILPETAERILVAMTLFVPTLDHEGLDAPARAYRDSLVQLAEIAVDIATQGNRWDELGALVDHAFRAAVKHNDREAVARSAQWGEEKLSHIPIADKRDDYVALLQRHRASLEAGLAGPGNADRDAVDQQIYRTMAKGVGIDLSDPNDPFAIMVRQGLADLNPERALRYCRRLFFSLGLAGLPAVLIGLPTAGFKRLRCTLHGYGVQEFALDACSEIMQREFCSKCSHREPHCAEWNWSNEWQQEQNAKFGHLANDERWR